MRRSIAHPILRFVNRLTGAQKCGIDGICKSIKTKIKKIVKKHHLSHNRIYICAVNQLFSPLAKIK